MMKWHQYFREEVDTGTVSAKWKTIQCCSFTCDLQILGLKISILFEILTFLLAVHLLMLTRPWLRAGKG
jgi:hypothetical protein